MFPLASRRPGIGALLTIVLAGCSSDNGPTIAVVSVSPSTSAVSLGASVQLDAVARDGEGDVVQRTFTWTSSNVAVVEVSNSGVATARAIGVATITAKTDGAAGSATVSTRMPVAIVEVSPDTSTLLLADTLQLVLTLKDSLGNILTDRDVTWTSGNAAAVPVTSSGQVIASAAGNAQISATVEGKIGVSGVDVIAFTAITAGEEHTCALTTSGAPYCWGAGNPMPTAVATDVKFRTIAAGQEFTCALAFSGAAYCWGANESGQLGDGTTTPHGLPAPVAGGLSFTAITAGWRYACALTGVGQVYCWGFNASGQLGNGTIADSPVPTQVTSAATFSKIDAAAVHVCGIGREATSSVYCWGSNSFDEAGFGAANPQMVPFPVPETASYSVISSSFNLSCGALPVGAVYCWGVAPLSNNGIPREPWPGTRLKTIELGYSSGCGLGLSSEAYCWGDNQFGQVGNGSTDGQILEPTPPSGSPRYVAITVGDYYACAITAVHVTFCWGRGEAGQLGRTLWVSRVPIRPTRVQPPTSSAPP